MLRTYRDFIKSLPCSVCADDTAVQQHHLIDIQGVLKGWALKAPEVLSIPLCKTHHDLLHANLNEFVLWYGSQEEHLARTLYRAHKDGWRWSRGD